MPDFTPTNFSNSFQAPPNPLATIDNLANVQNALNQNKMFQAKNLAGQYMQQSVGPDGQLDMGKFSSMVGSDPRLGPFAPEILQDAANLRQTGIQNQTQQYAMQTGQLDRAYGALGASVGQTPAQARQALQTLVDAKVISPEVAALPQFSTDDGITAAQQRAVMNGGSPQESNALLGTNDIENLGGKNQVINIKTVPGQAPVATTATGDAAALANTLGPHDLASTVSTVDDSGTPHMGVLGDYVNSDGSWKSGSPHPMTALGPLSQAASATLGASYGPQIASFEQAAAGAPQTRNLLENMRQESAQFDSGPQSDAYKNWGEFLSEYHIPAPDFASMDQTAAREAFSKTATMVLGAQQQALHMDQTDAARQTASAAVPGWATTPAGRQQVLGILEGNADMVSAAGKAWGAQKAKGGPASWGQFQMEFPNRVPPSIFQAQYMTPAQRTDMMSGWSAAKKSDWQNRYNQAAKLGWLPNAQ